MSPMLELRRRTAYCVGMSFESSAFHHVGRSEDFMSVHDYVEYCCMVSFDLSEYARLVRMSRYFAYTSDIRTSHF